MGLGEVASCQAAHVEEVYRRVRIFCNVTESIDDRFEVITLKVTRQDYSTFKG